MCFKRKAGSFPRIMTKSNRAVKIPHLKTIEVLPRFELGSLDSESRVLTITPQGRCEYRVINSVLNQECLNARVDEIRTRIAGFRVQRANHYTMGPSVLSTCVTCVFVIFVICMQLHQQIKVQLSFYFEANCK